MFLLKIYFFKNMIAETDVNELESQNESLLSIFCCFRICKRTEFSEHGLGVYAASPSEVCIFFCSVELLFLFSSLCEVYLYFYRFKNLLYAPI